LLLKDNQSKSFDLVVHIFNLLVGDLDALKLNETILLCVSSFLGFLVLFVLDTRKITFTISVVKSISINYSCVVNF